MRARRTGRARSASLADDPLHGDLPDLPCLHREQLGDQQAGGVTATSAQLAVPVVSGILSVAILHESLGRLKMLGAAIVLGGLLLIQRTGFSATNEPPPE
ncbi:MAG: DMT family transporter [Thermomicrobiales bacterium]